MWPFFNSLLLAARARCPPRADQVFPVKETARKQLRIQARKQEGKQEGKQLG
jgi:hypothetical protein